MSMSAPFDPSQDGQETHVDDRIEDEVEVEQARDGETTGDPSESPVREHADADADADLAEQDEAGGGPVFRRPEAGDRLHPEDLQP